MKKKKQGKPKPSRTIAAFDGNWFAWRFYHAVMRYNSVNWQETWAKQLCGSIASTAMRLGAKELIVFFDGPDNFRKDIFPGYKARRGHSKTSEVSTSAEEVAEEPDKGSPYEAFPLLFKYLTDFGIPFVQFKRYEADDLLASFAKLFNDNDTGKLYLVTPDKDVVQAITPRVHGYIPSVSKRPEVFKTPATLKGTMSAQRHLAYQVLAGDKIDDIPSVLSPAAAEKVVTDPEFIGLKSWFQTEAGAKLYKTQRAELVRNRKLVTLVTTCFKELPATRLEKVILPNHATAKVEEYHAYVFSKRMSLF